MNTYMKSCNKYSEIVTILPIYINSVTNIDLEG